MNKQALIAKVVQHKLSDNSVAYNVELFEGTAVVATIGAESQIAAIVIARAINDGAAWVEGV